VDAIESGPLLAVHPVCVHFAVALTVVAVVLDAAAGARGGRRRWQAAARINLGLGVGALAAAVASGWFEARLPRAEQPLEAQAQRLLQYHEYLGFALLGFFGLLLIWRYAAGMRAPRALTVLAFLGLGGLAVEGYLGGELVYRYGLGVKAVEFLSAGRQEAAAELPSSPKRSPRPVRGPEPLP
jgi:uncharacterized membrane protein